MKKVILLIICFLSSVYFVGCASKTPLDSKHPVELSMWHNYGGEMQITIDFLINKFNTTVGKEKGIMINVTAISSGSELNKSLSMIANGDPGAPQMPDLFTGYPKIAIQLQEKGMLANLDHYFTEEELASYVDAFIAEGRLSDQGLYVFPLAKSTEILYLNQTLFDEFSSATGASIDQLATFEGIAELSKLYYKWSGGKQFYAADSWFNVAEVGMQQLGNNLFFENGQFNLNNDTYRYIFDTLYAPSVEGGFAIYDGYASNLSKTGDLLCSTGSSAGILFFGDTITYPNGEERDVEYSILPYPVFQNGVKSAIQRGGGLIVSKTEEKKEYAASEFIKWITTPEQNMEFIAKTGYLPVTKQAFDTEIQTHLETVQDVRIKKMLTAVLDMYEDYSFFTAPNFYEFDEQSIKYAESYIKLMNKNAEEYQNGNLISSEDAYQTFMK